jgi:deoxyribodipyrimidine photolyase
MCIEPGWVRIDGNSCKRFNLLLKSKFPHYGSEEAVANCRRTDCQSDLSASITALNPKSKLFVLREAPQTLLPKLWKEWCISHLVFEKDTDAYGRERDDTIIKLAEAAGVKVLKVAGRTLWDSDEVVKMNGGKPTMTLSQLQAVSSVTSELGREADNHIGRQESGRDFKANTSTA